MGGLLVVLAQCCNILDSDIFNIVHVCSKPAIQSTDIRYRISVIRGKVEDISVSVFLTKPNLHLLPGTNQWVLNKSFLLLYKASVQTVGSGRK